MVQNGGFIVKNGCFSVLAPVVVAAASQPVGLRHCYACRVDEGIPGKYYNACHTGCELQRITPEGALIKSRLKSLKSNMYKRSGLTSFYTFAPYYHFKYYESSQF